MRLKIVLMPAVFFLILALFLATVLGATLKIQQKDPDNPAGAWQDVISASGSTPSISCYDEGSGGSLKPSCTDPGIYRAVLASDEGELPVTYTDADCYIGPGDYNTILCDPYFTLTYDNNKQVCQVNLGDDAWKESSYNANNKCCDSESDIGLLTKAPDKGIFMCIKNNEDFMWLRTALVPVTKESKPYIYSLPTFDALGTKTEWVGCKPPENSLFKTSDGTSVVYGGVVSDGFELGSHSFLCSPTQSANEPPQEHSSFTECCPTQLASCLHQGGGLSKPNGAHMIVPLADREQYYYCAEAGDATEWTINLDVDDRYAESCRNAMSDNNAWTGSKCCGDRTTPQESREYYNDNSEFTIGGCFNGIPIVSNRRVSDTNFVKHGSFDDAAALDNAINQIWSSFPQNNNDINIEQQQLKLRRDGTKGVYQNISDYIRPNTQYNLSVYGKAKDLTGGVLKVEIYNSLLQSSLPESTIIFSSGELGSKKSVLFSSPSDVNSLQIKIYIQDATGGVAVIDNVGLTIAKNKIMNYNGQFYGCKMTSDPNQNTDHPTYVPGYTDTVEEEPNLIIDRPFCNITGNYYCSPNTGWSDESVFSDAGAISFSQRTNLSEKYPGILAQGESATECCPENSCWNGTYCISDIASAPQIDPQGLNPYTGAGYLCVNGAWKEALLMTDVNGQQGYCPVNYCLIDSTQGAAGCIAPGSFVADYYCDTGKITSRTKFVAMELLAYAGSVQALQSKDYVLYCSNYSESLNDFEYMIRGVNLESNSVKRYISGEPNVGGYGSATSVCSDDFGTDSCANNFCVLKYYENNDPSKPITVFGTSLNKPINQSPYQFQDAVGVDCTQAGASNDNGFVSCADPLHRGPSKVWYNSSLMLVIASSQEIILSKPTLAEIYSEFFQNPLQSLVDLIIIIIKPHSGIDTAYDYKFIQTSRNFNKLYFNKQGNRLVRGYEESSAGQTAFAINYTGFNVDLCKTINIFSESNLGGEKVISCSQLNGIFYISTRNVDKTNLGGLGAWQDLTAKLRVQSAAQQPPVCVGDYPETCSAAGGTQVCEDYQKCSGSFKDTCSNGIGGAAKCCAGNCIDIMCKLKNGAGEIIETARAGSCFAVNKPNFCDYNGVIVADTSMCPCDALTADQVGNFCVPKCEDGTSYGKCSTMPVNLGKFCDFGPKLVDAPLVCGAVPITCPEGQQLVEDRCVTPATPTLVCSVTTDCQYTSVLAMSSEYNAHAEIIGAGGNYPYKVCCNAGAALLSVAHGNSVQAIPVPAGSTAVITLSDYTDAHVAAVNAQPSYADTVYLNSEGRIIDCVSSPGCPSDYACLASISSDTNAHIAKCTGDGAYQEKICCKLVSPACTPNCIGKQCGDDGCGGTCGTCTSGYCSNGQCSVACIPKTCSQLGKNCGIVNDGCGVNLNCGPLSALCAWQTFGTCSVPGTKTCSDGQYSECSAIDPRIANCAGKDCGGDGCGGSCGTGACSSGKTCFNGGCVPLSCSQDSDCGTIELIGHPFCQGNIGVQTTRTYRCENPGASNSLCTFNLGEIRETCLSGQTCVDGICCTPLIWSPDPSTVCSGQLFTQTSNCGTTRSAVGTQLPNCPAASSVYCGQPIYSTTGCGSCSGTGTYCSSGQTCSGSVCGLTCTSVCASGAKQCSGTTGYQTCGDYNSDGCLEWSTVTNCAGGQTCSGGQCGTTLFSLSVSKSGTGSGTVESDTGGIACGATCSVLYNSGESVTLTATGTGGNTFAGWSGACSGTGTCTVTMNAAKSVTAAFNVAQPACTDSDSGLSNTIFGTCTDSIGSYSDYCIVRDGASVMEYSCGADGRCRAGEYACPTGYACNVGVCSSTATYSWKTGPWSSCSVQCGSGGARTRLVQCERDDGAVMGNSYCGIPKPDELQVCNGAGCRAGEKCVDRMCVPK